MHAELASDYFTLRGVDAQQRAARSHRRRLRPGAAADARISTRAAPRPLSDVEQAQAQLETARTQAADTRLRRAQTEHAIAVLVGREASAFTSTARTADALGAVPPAIDPGLPSALLERRPDVAAAERRVAAANASIGVARAAYFPVFSLAAAAGFDSTAASNWISAPSRFWSRRAPRRC